MSFLLKSSLFRGHLSFLGVYTYQTWLQLPNLQVKAPQRRFIVSLIARICEEENTLNITIALDEELHSPNCWSRDTSTEVEGSTCKRDFRYIITVELTGEQTISEFVVGHFWRQLQNSIGQKKV